MQQDGHDNASNRAYHDLRQAIVRGELPTDRKVTEAGLSERLGISRTPIREAIKRLLLEGLLERRRGQGLWCPVPQADEIREIFDLRVRLESYAARSAAKHATAEQIDMLSASAARMSELVEADPMTDEVIEQIDFENSRFHAMIIDAAHSQRLKHLVKSTVDISLVSRTFRRFTPEQRVRSAYHHREIAASIAARAPAWAEKMMEIHILSAADIFQTSESADIGAPIK